MCASCVCGAVREAVCGRVVLLAGEERHPISASLQVPRRLREGRRFGFIGHDRYSERASRELGDLSAPLMTEVLWREDEGA